MLLLDCEGTSIATSFCDCTNLLVEHDGMWCDSELFESKLSSTVCCDSMRSHEGNICGHICIFIGYRYIVSYIFSLVNKLFSWIYFFVWRITSPAMRPLRSGFVGISLGKSVRILTHFSPISDTVRYSCAGYGWRRLLRSGNESEISGWSSWKKTSRRR